MLFLNYLKCLSLTRLFSLVVYLRESLEQPTLRVGHALELLTYIQLGQKVLPGTNALDYSSIDSAAKKKVL
jgi:hypothetical protein